MRPGGGGRARGKGDDAMQRPKAGQTGPECLSRGRGFSGARGASPAGVCAKRRTGSRSKVSDAWLLEPKVCLALGRQTSWWGIMCALGPGLRLAIGRWAAMTTARKKHVRTSYQCVWGRTERGRVGAHMQGLCLSSFFFAFPRMPATLGSPIGASETARKRLD